MHMLHHAPVPPLPVSLEECSASCRSGLAFTLPNLPPPATFLILHHSPIYVALLYNYHAYRHTKSLINYSIIKHINMNSLFIMTINNK